MRFGGYEFRNGVSQGRIWTNVEDRERVFAIVHATSREDDGDEVDTRIVEQWCRARLGQKLILVINGRLGEHAWDL